MLNHILLRVIVVSCICYYAECHYADIVMLNRIVFVVIMLSFIDYYYAECHYAEIVKLNSILLTVILLSVFAWLPCLYIYKTIIVYYKASPEAPLYYHQNSETVANCHWVTALFGLP